MSINHKELFKKGKAHYKRIKKCCCPVLKEYIFFNSKGFHHLKYDGLGHARTRKEQMYRIGLIPLIKPVIENAKKVSLYTQSTYSASLDKYVEYWELKEIVGKQHITVTVILRRIGTGNITFYSVWKKKDKKTKQSSK